MGGGDGGMGAHTQGMSRSSTSSSTYGGMGGGGGGGGGGMGGGMGIAGAFSQSQSQQSHGALLPKPVEKRDHRDMGGMREREMETERPIDIAVPVRNPYIGFPPLPKPKSNVPIGGVGGVGGGMSASAVATASARAALWARRPHCEQVRSAY
jgi:hypothetical protein